MRKLYHGGCHCGQVRFEATLDLTQGTLRCNCSYCRKMRVWVARLAPGDFRYVAGGESVAKYRINPDGADFHFCPKCGVRLGTGFDRPGVGWTFNVAVGTLESATVDELMCTPVQWVDGLNDRWTEVPDETRHL